MPTSPTRLLWTGPSLSAMVDRLFRDESLDPSSIWLVPSPLARIRILRGLSRRFERLCDPLVWTWEDLWTQVRAHRPSGGPSVLSDVACREFLRLSITQAQESGDLDRVGRLASTAGYRRHLQTLFSAWSTRFPELPSDRPAFASPDAWAVYTRYRHLLHQHQAADLPTFRLWAARLVSSTWPQIAGARSVQVLDPPTSPLERLALKSIIKTAPSIRILMPWEDDPERRDVHAELARMHAGCLAFQFQETSQPPLSDRPDALRALQHSLFRDPEPPPIESTDGLTLLGSPQGDGSALRLARAVLDKLESGSSPEDVLILFPRWSDLADRTLETLSQAGIPAQSLHPRPLSSDPSISALRLVLEVPLNGWETTTIAGLLRLGPLRIPGFDRAQLASAASAIRALRVFRGFSAIRSALKTASIVDPDEQDASRKRKARRASIALNVLDTLATLFEPPSASPSWDQRLDQLRTLLDRLSLRGPALNHLLASLEDSGSTRHQLEPDSQTWPWDAFCREVLSLASELPRNLPAPAPGSVLLALVSDARGASARHVLLAGLDEGTFPDADALEPEALASDDETNPSDLAFSREMRRFLSVLDIPSRSLTLAYPTTDDKGVSLHPAGFLDDVRRRFSEAALKAIDQPLRRLDPIVPASLALSPTEQRVRAVGLACLKHPDGLNELTRLAGMPRHRPALLGTARALRVAAQRRRRRHFGLYDGDLGGSRIQPLIAREFAASRPAPFSASQLETLANCPFQFFLRHVLKLEPTEEPDELGEDFAARGQLIHAVLQNLHDALRDAPDSENPLTDQVRAQILDFIRHELDRLPPPASDVDEGRRAIDSERLKHTGQLYASQFASYASGLGQSASCRRCEVAFGRDKADFPPLRIGDDADGLGLQGIIDRIDMVPQDDATLFRVIDYKTGSCPDKSELKNGLALQLPLYALAVERIILAEEHAEPLDVGYWALRGDGFKPFDYRVTVSRGKLKVNDNWAEDLRAVESFVLELVQHLRSARFPVAPRRDDCTRMCDYKHVCRIGQIRTLRKSWSEAPSLKRSS